MTDEAGLAHGTALVVFALMAGACSSGSASAQDTPDGGGPAAMNIGGGTLDCAWLEGSNCWKTTIAAAKNCLPAGEQGTLSADGLTCTFTSGKTVAFLEPLVFPIPRGKEWQLTVKKAGEVCLRLEHPAQGFMVTSATGVVTERLGSAGITVSCPDGHAYASTNANGLLMCGEEAGGSGGLPGIAVVSSSNSASLSLLGTEGGSLVVFSCKQP